MMGEQSEKSQHHKGGQASLRGETQSSDEKKQSSSPKNNIHCWHLGANGWAGPRGPKVAKPADFSQKLTLVMGHV